jgi:leader peptidase (prepilin peptidase)/N-methyltransferase
VQYLLVELLTGSVFAITVYYFGFTWQALLLLILFANLIVILITDFREQYIFDINSLGLIPFGVLYACMMGYQADSGVASLGPVLLQCVTAVGFAWISFWILNFISQLFFGVEGFGEGDVRLLMGIGAFFGLKPVIIIFVASFALQISLTVPLVFFQWTLQRKYKILLLFLASILLSVCPYFMVDWLTEAWLRIVVTLGFGVVAMTAAFKAIKLSQEQQGGLTYLPFGPAICFACGLFVFYQGYLT